MRRAFLVLMMIGCAESAHAQALGYAIAGPAGFHGFFGSNSSAVQGAAGAEALILGRGGVGAEFGVIANAGGGMLVFSANGVFHILRATGTRKPSPFVTGGYTRMSSGEGSFEAWNAGAGVDIWPKNHFGVRAEFRNHVRPDSRGTVHYWTLRAGLVVR